MAAVRFEANGTSLNDEDDVFGPDSPGIKAPLEYTPYYERENLSPEEQEMWDSLVQEEMMKMEQEFKEQAMLGGQQQQQQQAEASRREEEALLALAQQQSTTMAPVAGGRYTSHSHSSSHHLLPDPDQRKHKANSSKFHSRIQQHDAYTPPTTTADLKILNAPVTVIMAKKSKAPPVEPVFVPNTILSGIGAASRRAERQKISKQEEFKRLVALDEENRRVAQGEATSGVISKVGRGKAIDEMISEENSYNSRWDTMGANSKREEALLKKKRLQREYAELLKAQQMERSQKASAAADWVGTARSLSLPTEISPYEPTLNDGKTRFTNRFKSSTDQEYHEKRIKQLEYHEQLARQISFTSKDNDGDVKTTATSTTKRSTTAPDYTHTQTRHADSTEDVVSEGRSILDTIGGTHYQRSDSTLKRQQQLQYYQELTMAATMAPLPTDRISLRDKYRNITSARTEPVATSIDIGGTHHSTLDNHQLKREKQQEYARQIEESASKVPLQSPRSSLRSHRQLKLASDQQMQPPPPPRIDSMSGPSSFLANGLSSMGPSTTHMLKKAQQEQYKQSLEKDMSMRRAASDAYLDDDQLEKPRISLWRRDRDRDRHDPDPSSSTGLFVGPDIGTATRHAIAHNKQEEYARQLAKDKTTPAIPTLFVPKQKPPSACSPRPGEDDNGYWAVGTSIQVGVPTAIAKDRFRANKINYQQQLDNDLVTGPRRASPPRRSSIPERDYPQHTPNPKYTSLDLNNTNDVDTATALIRRQLERQKYLALMEEARLQQPIVQERVSLVAQQQQQQRQQQHFNQMARARGDHSPRPAGDSAVHVGGGGGRLQRRATSEEYFLLRSAEASQGGW